MPKNAKQKLSLGEFLGKESDQPLPTAPRAARDDDFPPLGGGERRGYDRGPRGKLHHYIL
eukprot:TRINITY_DN15748_c0_g1_i6.p1 TRINITY_DN15748_c0_g1~~TRINITY_DN15748_c0_g1_i6.p1  ORF type:complete len:60 (-),score=24.35 TRINITY_DN15748_c0_g1_i6:32-211(-)